MNSDLGINLNDGLGLGKVGSEIIEAVTESSRTLTIRKAEKRLKQCVEAYKRSVGYEFTDTQKMIILNNCVSNVQGFENICSVFDDPPYCADVDPVSPDDEWFDAYINGAKAAFSDWNRKIHSEIFRSEIVSPGSISRMTLGKITQLGEKDISSFITLCEVSYVDKEGQPLQPLVFSLLDKEIEEIGLCSRQIRILSEIGFIKIRDRTQNIPKDDRKIPLTEIKQGIWIEDEHVIFRTTAGNLRVIRPKSWYEDRPPYGARYSVNLGIVEFTEAGKELASTVKVEMSSELKKYIVNSYRRIERAAIRQEADRKAKRQKK